MRRGSTKVSTSVNMAKVAEGLSRPGIDTRVWVLEGIVATLGEDGAVNDTDTNAHITAPEGREVDVAFLPTAYGHGTCRIPSGGPDATDDAPIGPGDHVLVLFPEGEPGNGGVVIAVLNSASDRLPTEGGQPMFKNDRRLLWTRTTPIDLRAGSGTGRLYLTPQGLVLAGGPDASHEVLLGDDFVAELKTLITGTLGLAEAFGDLLAACGSPPTPPLGPLAVGFGKAKLALEAWGAKATVAGDWLSQVLKTK